MCRGASFGNYNYSYDHRYVLQDAEDGDVSKAHDCSGYQGGDTMDNFDWVAIDDGYGTVGYGFKCPYCGKLNMFVDELFEPHTCKFCDEPSMPSYECPDW